MTEIEYAGIVLEDQLLDHLATPEGSMAVWREKLSPELISDSDAGVRDALEFVLGYMDTYRESPDVSVLMEETGYDTFEEPIAPIAYVIEKLRERYQRKQMKQTITKLGRLSGNPQEALNYGFSEFTRIRSETASRGNGLDTSDMLTVIERYKERLNDPTSGITFGYEEMDVALGGIRKNGLYFTIGRPKRYKSWQLLKSAIGAVFREEGAVDVDLNTLELSEQEMLDRITCMVSGISWSKFQFGALMPADLAELERVAREIQEWPNKIHIRRPPRGERTVQHMLNAAMEAESAVCYIDQLSFIESSRKHDARWMEVAYICEDLKEAAASIPMMVAAQFNREAEGMKGMADLSKIGLSDSIGQTADMVLGLYADKEMHSNRLLHYGVVEARSFEPVVWELNVKLSDYSNFRLVNRVED